MQISYLYIYIIKSIYYFSLKYEQVAVKDCILFSYILAKIRFSLIGNMKLIFL